MEMAEIDIVSRVLRGSGLDPNALTGTQAEARESEGPNCVPGSQARAGPDRGL